VHPGIIEPYTPVTQVGRVPVHLGNSRLRRLLGVHIQVDFFGPTE
jgi:hypothetical protein